MKKEERVLAKNALPNLEEQKGMGFCRTYRYGNRAINLLNNQEVIPQSSRINSPK